MKSLKFSNHYQKVLKPLDETEELLDLLETTNALSVEDQAIGNTSAKKAVVIEVEVSEAEETVELAAEEEEEVLLVVAETILLIKEEMEEEIEAEVADPSITETTAEIEMTEEIIDIKIEMIDEMTEMVADTEEEEDLHHQEITALCKEDPDLEIEMEEETADSKTETEETSATETMIETTTTEPQLV